MEAASRDWPPQTDKVWTPAYRFWKVGVAKTLLVVQSDLFHLRLNPNLFTASL